MGRYLPGYKDGGPVRSIKNLVDYLGQEYEFRILTCDRDHGDLEPYQGVKVNDWNQVGNAQVFYVPPKGFHKSLICKLADECDLVYVCGCFNDYSINTLLLNRLGKIKKPVVFAAMGLFSPMAFRIKYKKKKLFTSVFNALGMFKHIYWSATSEMEIKEIQSQVKSNRDQFFIAEDLPRIVKDRLIQKNKETNALKVVWISRIVPKKNLVGAIDILREVPSTCSIDFTIYGPKEDDGYWQECEEKLQKLPKHITWNYEGMVDSESVVDILEKHHVFLFPTFGENYGHVIQEALSAGCPCILSNQTPWTELEDVYSLEQQENFVNSLVKYANMEREEFQTIVNSTIRYAIRVSNQKVESTGYRKVFAITSRN